MTSQYRGFTLVELMIVVAIIAVLAAIAIPNFIAMQLRSRAAEIGINAEGLMDAAIAHGVTTEWATVPSTSYPLTPIGKAAQPWPNPGVDPDTAAHDAVGWRPDGGVRCRYAVSVDSGTTSATLFIICNMDEDIYDVDSELLYYQNGQGVYSAGKRYRYQKCNGSMNPVSTFMSCAGNGYF